MRAASFRVAGQGGKVADVSVVPLPGLAGSDLDNVNRWRGMVGLKGVAEAELAQLAQAVVIDARPGQLYEQAGENAGSGEKSCILAAISRQEGMTWFFKMMGDPELVAQQKPTFVAFLQSVSFAGEAPQELPPSHPPISGGPELPASHPPIGGGAMGTQTAAVASTGQDKPEWQVPAGWQEVSGGQFLVAKFLLTGANNAQAAVNVSMSTATEGGGLLANLNRWRGQLGLAPVTEADLAKQLQPLAGAGSEARQAEMTGTDSKTGQPARLLAAIVPQAQQTWFYKLMGNEQIVEREREAFTKFVQGAKYHE
jgi:hypothetical protein